MSAQFHEIRVLVGYGLDPQEMVEDFMQVGAAGASPRVLLYCGRING